jgi:hypothetical protein
LAAGKDDSVPFVKKIGVADDNLIPWCRVLLEKLTVAHVVKKSPAPFWSPKVHYPVSK